MSIPSLRAALQPSGLFLEGTEAYSRALPTSTYYGFNVTKTEREPIDQIHGFIAARRIQERNRQAGGEAGAFYPFVAGIFEVLNATSEEEVARIREINGLKEQQKRALFERILQRYNLAGEVPLTQDLWGDAAYWEIVSELLDTPTFTQGSLRQDTLKWYSNPQLLDQVCSVATIAPDLMNLSPRLLKRIGRWPAAILYTPIEVAEAQFFARQRGVRCKIGHMDETVYDKYIIPFMDVVHLRQPADLKSTRLKPRGVTPYIDKDRPRDPKVRVYFDDTVESLRERVAACALEEYVFTLIPGGGEVLNPILDKCVLAVESARCLEQTPVRVAGIAVDDGSSLIQAVYDERVRIADLAEALPDVVHSFLIAPFRETDASR